MIRVGVAGTLCADLIPRVGQEIAIPRGRILEIGPLAVRAGGCVGNTGADLADLGVDVRAIGSVGTDELASLLRSSLRQRGVDDDFVTSVAGADTSYSIVIEPAGVDRTFWHHTGANQHFDGSSVDLSAIDVLHVGYPPLLSRFVAGEGALIAQLLAAARERGVTTSVDLAAVSAGTKVDWRRWLANVLPHVDVLTPSVDDLAGLLRGSSAPSLRHRYAIADEFIEMGAGAVMITAGSREAVLRVADHVRLSSGGALLAAAAPTWAGTMAAARPRRARVGSTTGAGDAATAGLLCGLVRGVSATDALDLAMWASAHRVRGPGALPRYTAWRSSRSAETRGTAPSTID